MTAPEASRSTGTRDPLVLRRRNEDQKLGGGLGGIWRRGPRDSRRARELCGGEVAMA